MARRTIEYTGMLRSPRAVAAWNEGRSTRKSFPVRRHDGQRLKTGEVEDVDMWYHDEFDRESPIVEQMLAIIRRDGFIELRGYREEDRNA